MLVKEKIKILESKKYETQRGVVKDIQVHKRICEEIKFWFESVCNCKVINITQSPIKGPKGNIEFLLTAKYQKNEDNDLQ